MQSATLELRGLRRSFGALVAVASNGAHARRTRLLDAAARAAAGISVVTAVAIGLEHPVGIVLLALGLLLVVALESRRHNPRGGMH